MREVPDRDNKSAFWLLGGLSALLCSDRDIMRQPYEAMAPVPKDISQPSRVSIRCGTVADLEAILDIALAALPMDPQWDYRFPHRQAYPSDTRKHTKMRYRDFLEDSQGRWLVMLADERSEQDSREPIAFAVWDIQNFGRQKTGRFTRLEKTLKLVRRPSFRPRRRDGDCRRMQAWTDTTAVSKKLLFDTQFGAGHFQLQILATHPESQRQGAGAQLVGWGMQLAQHFGMAISVFASPMGEQLYRRLGFRALGSVFVNVEKEQEKVVLAAMVYLPAASGKQPPTKRTNGEGAREDSHRRTNRACRPRPQAVHTPLISGGALGCIVPSKCQ